MAARDLVEFVSRQLTDDMADAALDGLRPADLYLACACAKGSTTAIAAFDRDYMREVDIALARMRTNPASVYLTALPTRLNSIWRSLA